MEGGPRSVDLVVVGVSHHTAPVEMRERLALPEEALAEACHKAAAISGGHGGEAMILSTCNRVEFYLAAEEGRSLSGELAALLDAERRPGAPSVPIGPHLYEHAGEAALRHLFRVAASLDSMVVGEPQILGQVKDAYE